MKMTRLNLKNLTLVIATMIIVRNEHEVINFC